MPKKHLLNQVQLESLTSPIRLAIVQRLEMDGQATARELAQRLGRPVTALYHHLKQMEDIGLLHVVAERKGPRRPEAVYALPGNLSSAEAVTTRQGRNAYSRAAARVADAGARAFSAAAAKGNPRFDGEYRNTMVRYFLLRADKKKLARINKLLDSLEDALLENSCEDGEEIQLTVLLSPVPRKGQATPDRPSRKR